MPLLIQILIVVILVGVVAWAIGAIPMPPPFRTAAIVILAVIVLVWALRLLGWVTWPGGRVDAGETAGEGSYASAVRPR